MPQRSYPLARFARIIGRPFQGTHTIRNPDGTFQWQSCRAFDLSTPIGTPVLAIWDGVIGQRFGPLGSTDPRFGGLRCYVEVPRGNQFYYAHLSSFAPGIKPGVKVTSGQVIGLSGAANGAAHLHVACRLGDPLTKLLTGRLPAAAPDQVPGDYASVPLVWECANAVPPGEGAASPADAPETES